MIPPVSDNSVLGRALAKARGERPRPLPVPLTGPSRYSALTLRALQGKHIYAGTVPDAEVERRRSRNKAARRSRRINRVRAR